jgi:putative ABC transport system permease protein
MARTRFSAIGLFTRLASQNIIRRPARTAMLVVAVALVLSAIFASLIIGRGIQASIERSFSQMGADLIVVPTKTMVNITSALLTVQPTDEIMSTNIVDQIAKFDGVEKVSRQSFYRIPMMAHMPEHKGNLIVFDSADDFTILPWLKEHLNRPMAVGDLLSGARRDDALGEEMEPCATPAVIYGKLGRSGVGPLDDSLFTTYDTAAKFAQGKIDGKSAIPTFERNNCSVILVRLKFGVAPELVRFAISQIEGVKVISGATIVTSTRQTTSALLSGMLAFSGLMLASALILIGLLFSAIVSERRREIGLLAAIGARRESIVSMLLAEACFTTGAGGLLGIALGAILLMIFQRSLVYYLATLHVEFIWCTPGEMAIYAVICTVLAVLGGLLGALVPALKASASEPYSLIQNEGG